MNHNFFFSFFFNSSMVTTETSYSIWKLNFPVVASIYEKEYSVGTVSYNTEHCFVGFFFFFLSFFFFVIFFCGFLLFFFPFLVLQCQHPRKWDAMDYNWNCNNEDKKAFPDLQVNCTAASYTHMINHIMIPSK